MFSNHVFRVVFLSVVLLVVFAACGGDDSVDLNGTWTDSDGETITLSNGSFVVSDGGTNLIKGTYTADGRNITLTVTALWGAALNEGLNAVGMDVTLESRWYTKDQIIEVFSAWMAQQSLTDEEISAILAETDFEDMFPTITGTINGNTMLLTDSDGDTSTYTKGPGGNANNSSVGGSNSSNGPWVAPASHVMVLINSGVFTMGTPDGENIGGYTATQHQVTLTRGFYMGKYQVTQELYQAVRGSNPSGYSTKSNHPPVAGEVAERRPVENVTWSDAVRFCNTLSALEGRTSVYTIDGNTVTANWNANGYRLPTEAEWEYACRAGSTTAYNLGDTWNDAWGWWSGNSDNKSHEVGKKLPNAWGLYDMHGNVWEWCWDGYALYPNGDATDPKGPEQTSTSSHINRGGSLQSQYSRVLRSDYRDCNSFTYKLSSIGFRVVRNAN